MENEHPLLFHLFFPPPNLPHILTVKTICDTSDSIIEMKEQLSLLEQIGVVSCFDLYGRKVHAWRFAEMCAYTAGMHLPRTHTLLLPTKLIAIRNYCKTKTHTPSVPLLVVVVYCDRSTTIK